MAESVERLKNQLSGLQEKYIEIEELNRNLNERFLEIYSLYQVSLTLSTTLDLEEILRAFKSLFKKTFKVEQYSIMLLNESTEMLKIISSYGIPKSSHQNQNYELDANIFSKAFKSEELIHVSDMENGPDYEYYHHTKKNLSGAFLSIPLKPGKNHTIGVLNLYRAESNSFQKRELVLMSKVAEQIAKVIDKTLIYKHTKELSITDELTRLYNRRYFNQRLEREVMRAKRYKRPLTTIMIDIDYFKNYNDINGHILGDDVLKKVGVLLENNIRKADILARYGGEEFVLLLPEIDKHHAFKVAEKLRQTVETSHFPGEHHQPNKRITISLGIATLLEDTYSAKELLEFADKALYEAKKLGRNQVAGYHDGLNSTKFSIYPLSSVASNS